MRQPYFTFGDWTVRPAQRVIERGDERTSLEPKLMDVLVALASRAPDVVSTDDLLAACWAGHFYGDNPVHKAIAQLRRALGDDARAPRYIATIRKRGYQLVAPVAFPHGGPTVTRLPGSASGPPHPGRRPFDVADAPLFFGRRRSTFDIARRLAGAHAHGYALLLVVGPPLSGKTSLVHAGVASALLDRAGYEGLRALALATLRADHASEHPLEALAAAMCGWRIEGDAIFVDTERASLGRSLSGDLDLVLGRIAHRLRAPGEVLLLIVDDLDTLLRNTTDIALARAFLRAISSLATSGRVVIVGTCQDPVPDARMAGHPAFPPGAIHTVEDYTSGELAQMIRLPAHAAGVRFAQEPDTEHMLDDVLLDHARRLRHPLRALPFLLRALYDAADHGVLTFEAYRQTCASHPWLDEAPAGSPTRHLAWRQGLVRRLHRRLRRRLLKTAAVIALGACCLVSVTTGWRTRDADPVLPGAPFFDGSGPETWLDLAKASDALGRDAARRGRAHDAGAYFDHAVRWKRRVTGMQPASRKTWLELADSLRAEANVERRRGRLPAALRLAEQERQAVTIARTDGPSRVYWLRRRALAELHIAEISLALGKVADSTDLHAQAGRTLAELAQSGDLREARHHDLGVLKTRHGALTIALGDAAGAMPELAEGERRLRQVANSDRSDMAVQTLLARNLVYQSTAQLALGDRLAAAANATEALVLLDRRGGADTRPRAQLLRATAHFAAAQAADASGRHATATAYGKHVAETLTPLVANGKDDPAALDLQVRVALFIGHVDEAASGLARLRRIGYRPPTFRVFVQGYGIRW